MIITGFAVNADAGFLDGNLEKLRGELTYYLKTGFSHVELSPHGVGVVYNGRLISERMAELLEVLGWFPFNYTVHGPNTLNLMNLKDLETERNLFLASIEFTQLVKANILVYHSGRYIPEENFLNRHYIAPKQSEMKMMWDTEKKLLREMSAVAKDCGITIALENARPYLDGSPYCYAEKPDQLTVMVEEVNRDNVGICLDIGHAYLSARFFGFDFISAIAAATPHIKHIHLHDNYGKASTSYEKKQVEMAAVGRGDMHMPVGWGEIPLAEVLSVLNQYQGIITLEMRPRYRQYYSESLTKMKELVSSCC